MDTVGIGTLWRARRRLRRCAASWRRRSLSLRMRSRIKRRSTSSWVSPGPRRPMPPRWRSRWVQPRTSRLARCSSCASSTCSLPSCERARCAKMSRISPVRSTTRQATAFSRLRSCAGESAWFTTTRSAPRARAASRISCALPLPTKLAASGRSRLATTAPTTSAPAERASWPSSPSSPSAARPLKRTCTGRARSRGERAAGTLIEGLLVAGPLAFRGFKTVELELHRAVGNHGRDGVLVDHLADRVLEQHHELVERLDLPLQLDAVHQKNRYRDVLLAQGVQKRVLQRLPFLLAHNSAPVLIVARRLLVLARRLLVLSGPSAVPSTNR